jgi:hypothetical protein
MTIITKMILHRYYQLRAIIASTSASESARPNGKSSHANPMIRSMQISQGMMRTCRERANKSMYQVRPCAKAYAQARMVSTNRIKFPMKRIGKRVKQSLKEFPGMRYRYHRTMKTC